MKTCLYYVFCRSNFPPCKAVACDYKKQKQKQNSPLSAVRLHFPLA